jgi:hypothetical protein
MEKKVELLEISVSKDGVSLSQEYPPDEAMVINIRTRKSTCSFSGFKKRRRK